MTGHPMAVPPRGEPSENFGLAQLGKLAQAGGRASGTHRLAAHDTGANLHLRWNSTSFGFASRGLRGRV